MVCFRSWMAYIINTIIVSYIICFAKHILWCTCNNNENEDENVMKNRTEKAKYNQNGNNEKDKDKDAKVDDMKNTGNNNIESVHLANDIINKISSIFEMNYIARHVLLVVDQELLELMVIIKKKIYEKVLKLTRNYKRNFSVLFIKSKCGHEYICLAHGCDYYYNLFLMECTNVHYNSIKQQYNHSFY